MRKTFFAALAACCALGMAQAVTFDWTASAATSGQDFAQSFAAGTSFTVAVVFNGPLDPATSGNLLLQVSHNPGARPTGSAGPTLAIDQSGAVSVRSGVTVPSNTLDLSGVTDGRNVFAITVKSEAAGVNYDVTFEVYLNDGKEPLLSFTHSQVGGTVADFEYIRTGLTDATFYYGEGIATPDQIAQLPEPTALALLALGVAGLALRRRAA